MRRRREANELESPDSRSRDFAWFLAQRRSAFEGEGQANFLRVVAIGGFYAIHLLNRYGVRIGALEMPPLAGIDAKLHAQVTALAVVWLVVALAVRVSLQSRMFPAVLKFITTALDIILLTSALCILDGPRSPLVVAYFPLLTASALRFSHRLIGFATMGCMLGYLTVCGCARWFTERELQVPRYEQLTLLLALLLTGFFIAQVVGRARHAAVDYSAAAEQGKASQTRTDDAP